MRRSPSSRNRSHRLPLTLTTTFLLTCLILPVVVTGQMMTMNDTDIDTDTNTTTATPSVAPSTSSPEGDDDIGGTPCSPCPMNDQNVTNPQGRFQQRTCAAWEDDATAGRLSADECASLRESVGFQAVCDCAVAVVDGDDGDADATTPTSMPTFAPTILPTAVPRTYETTVIMVLSNVTVAMSPVHRNYFGPQLARYLEERLRPTTSLGRNWEGVLVEQRLLNRIPDVEEGGGGGRALRSSNRHLQITVSAPLATVTRITAKQNVDAPVLDPGQLDFFVQDTLQSTANQEDFLEFLVNTSSPTLVVYFEKIRDITVFPSDTPIEDFPERRSNGNLEADDELDDDDSGFFTLWAIVGIVGGVGVCLLVVAIVLLCVMQPETMENSPRAAAADGSPRGGGGGAFFSTSPTKTPSGAAAATNGTEQKKERPPTAEDDTTYYGNASILNPPTVNPHDDNQSYAYSLEPGNFDTATVTGTLGGGAGSGQPQQRQQTKSSKSKTKDAPSLAADDSRSIYTTRRGPMVLRDIHAPPGKLGIIIDTSLEGPVVHKVNENSPLLGKIFAGDVITSINGIDTRAMKASAITGIMVRTAHEPRALTVASEDNTTK